MPKFYKNTSICTFLDMNEVVMYSASDTQKASDFLLNLDPSTSAIILPYLQKVNFG